MHRFAVGDTVRYAPAQHIPAASGVYKVVRRLPIERDNEILYRIKSQSETFERTAEEEELSAYLA
jgi:hypothetical protein